MLALWQGHRISDCDMNEKTRSCEVINLPDRRDRDGSREHTPLASYALERCEETFSMRAWDRFRYWHAIYVR